MYRESPTYIFLFFKKICSTMVLGREIGPRNAALARTLIESPDALLAQDVHEEWSQTSAIGPLHTDVQCIIVGDKGVPDLQVADIVAITVRSTTRRRDEQV